MSGRTRREDGKIGNERGVMDVRLDGNILRSNTRIEARNGVVERCSALGSVAGGATDDIIAEVEVARSNR